ncbi:MAG: hypothetical protein ACYCR7_01155 [Thermoplasmataceae archaeon]
MFLDFLPVYSPEPNSMERVWKLMKRLRLHKQYFPTLNEMIKILAKQFMLSMKGNETLRMLCYME